MYGGYDGSSKFSHLFIVELERHSVVSVFTIGVQKYQKLHLIQFENHYYVRSLVKICHLV